MKELNIKETAPFRRSSAFDMEANAFFNEYYDLTGQEFPACNQNDWNSLDDWFVDLKLAVYRERALREVYGKNCNVIPIKGIRKSTVLASRVS